MEINFEYKTVRIKNTGGCMVLQKLIDISLNHESQEGWQLYKIFPHSCDESSSCLVAIFQRESRA